MIEKMKQVSLVAVSGQKADMLDALRDLGLVHLAERNAPEQALTEEFAGLSRRLQELKDYAKDAVQAEEPLTSEEFEALDASVRQALARIPELEAKRGAALLEAEKLKAWGDFDPAEYAALKAEGLDLHIYRLGKKEFQELQDRDTLRYIRLAPVDKMETVAVLGELEPDISALEFALPEKGLSRLQREAEEAEAEIAGAKACLKAAAAHLSDYDAAMLAQQNRMELSSVSRTAGGDGELVWLTGYVPEAEEEAFTALAGEKGWAFALGDIAPEDDKVPTKVKYNKVTALMAPVFDILGTVPGYREYDISFWFLCYFALFFAMIIGDAGYGLVFLIGAVALNIKARKAGNAVKLLYVMSVATIAWGAVTGTWFGLEGAMKIPFLRALVIPGITNWPGTEYFPEVSSGLAQNNVMKFCFSVGTTQLGLACLMSVGSKLKKKDLSFVADLGWLLSICALYFMVLFLVVGQKVKLGTVAVCVGAGFLLVILFGGMSPDKSFSKGLKAGLGDAFTVFLNTISAFGNIMSYIRLFAVGLASLAIAKSFNDMAANFSSGPTVVVGALIMIIGHVLNIVMGALSVVVHGIRLNLLEFSGQLGMEWSGTAYDPFRKLNKLKK